MTLDELKIEWENRIYRLTEQYMSFNGNDCEKALIKEEKEILMRCLEEIKRVEK